ncbi:MAG: hypothetical protein GQ529_03260 [Methyloprofundus sp.]|nr:hypothetical protein [Methyloprofundus sp.]
MNKVRVKKRYKKKKKNFAQIVFYFCLILATIIWAFYEVTKPQIAKEWADSRVIHTQNILLPKDDGYHSDKMEWWYYNGHLVTESGKKYSFHFTTFLVNHLMTHTVFHSSLSDHSRNRHYTDQSRTGGNPSAGVKNSFNFEYRDWLMMGKNGSDRLKVANDHFAFDLQLENSQPVVTHSNNGIISLGFAGSSYYYSRTRMNITGVLEVDGKKELVNGMSWFDHQWGDFLPTKLSWDWFSLQLDNGIDLMLYQLRDKQGNPMRDKQGNSVLYFVSVSESGITEILNNTEFLLTPGAKWVSKKTGNSYPVFWSLTIPEKKIDIKIEGIIKNSEFNAKATTYLTYWEGAVTIKGSHTGQGFMELQGYGPENK